MGELGKKCNNCNSIKNISDFHKRSSVCKKCVSEKGKIHRSTLIIVEVVDKKCSKCKEVKKYSDFNKRKDSKDGLKGYCRICELKFKAKKRGVEYFDKSLIEEGFKKCKTCKDIKEDICFLYENASCKECVLKRDKIKVFEKRCSMCNTIKNIEDFYKNKYSKDNHTHTCKSCKKEIYLKKDVIPKKDTLKKCNYCNNIYGIEDMVLNKKVNSGVSSMCKECSRVKSREWKSNNKEKHISYSKERIKSDPVFKLSIVIRQNINGSFKRACQGKYKKSEKTENILGCTIPEFIEHLQSLFTEGMTLENHGNCEECWHIDHKIPLSTAETEEDIIKLCHYTNLQPLWKFDNLSKGYKI
jgi:hypothetical protein